jgi:hypothetical protein
MLRKASSYFCLPYLFIYAITPCPTQARQRGYCAISICPCTRLLLPATSTLMLALIHALLLVCSLFLASIQFEVCYVFFHPLFLLYICITIVSLCSLILSIWPNHLSIFTFIPTQNSLTLSFLVLSIIFTFTFFSQGFCLPRNGIWRDGVNNKK